MESCAQLWGRRWPGLTLWFLICASTAGAAEQATEVVEATPVPVEADARPEVRERSAAELEGYDLWGVVRQSYRHRNAHAVDEASGLLPGSDRDARLTLDAGFSDARGDLAANAALSLWYDLDGNRNRPAPHSFASLHDAAGDLDILVHALNAHLGLGAAGSVDFGRLTVGGGSGRITIDGVSTRLRPLSANGAALSGSELLLFGGRTVHFFERGGGYFEDWVVSPGLRLRPAPTVRVDLDYRLMIEDRASGTADHGYGATFWYRPRRGVSTNVYARGLDDALAHAGGKTRLFAEALEAGLDGSIDLQPSILEASNELDDPYSAVLGRSRPRVRWMLEAWKRVDSPVADGLLHVGWSGRRRLRGTNQAFNRSYYKVYSTAEAVDIAELGLFASVSGEYHRSGDHRGLFVAGGAAGVDHALGRIEAGTYYQSYKYTYYRDVDEREDVETYFVSLLARPLPWLRLRISYDYELFDREVHTFTFSASQSLERRL